jgi:hypothetical protein
MFAARLGANCARFEVHRALSTPGAPTPPFAAAAYFWVSSPEEFGVALAEHAEEVYADIAKFSQTQPVRGWGQRLILSSGGHGSVDSVVAADGGTRAFAIALRSNRRRHCVSNVHDYRLVTRPPRPQIGYGIQKAREPPNS